MQLSRLVPVAQTRESLRCNVNMQRQGATTKYMVLAAMLLAVACNEGCPGFRAGTVDYPSASNGTIQVQGPTLDFTYRRPAGETRGTPYEALFTARQGGRNYSARVRSLGGDSYQIDTSALPNGSFTVNIDALDGAPTNFEVGAEGGVTRSACSGSQPIEPEVEVVRTGNP